MEIKIIATTGRAQGQSVEIKAAKFFIGRHDNCQLRPDIPGLSGIHALIEQREIKTYLRDFGGEGGTGINDRVLHAREAEIFDGDLIQIGPMVLTLSIKPKRNKLPLATFEGSIRVGQEKAVIVEEISLLFGYADAANTPVPISGVGQSEIRPGAEPPVPVAAATQTEPLRVAANA